MSALEKEKGLIITGPINYIRFMNLVFNCRFALTDSGGIQEETTYLGIPCLTLRPNTERPIRKIPPFTLIQRNALQPRCEAAVVGDPPRF